MHEKFAERLAELQTQMGPEESTLSADVITMAGKALLSPDDEAKLYREGLSDYCRGARETPAAQYYVAWVMTH